MSVKLLTEHHLEFLTLKGGCTGSCESTHVKMPHCWKSHVTAQIFIIWPSGKIAQSFLLCWTKRLPELKVELLAQDQILIHCSRFKITLLYQCQDNLNMYYSMQISIKINHAEHFTKRYRLAKMMLGKASLQFLHTSDRIMLK